MPLIYSAVARGPVILAEYSVFAGNFQQVTKDYLSKSSNGGRFSYTVDSHVFSFLSEEGYCELFIASEDWMCEQCVVLTAKASCRLRGGHR